jgi:hypothetical protein
MGQPPVQWSGQLSAWGNLNNSNELPVWFGGRFLPQVNVILNPGSENKFDFEASANLNGSYGFGANAQETGQGTFKPYRVWARYSTNQFEMRAGLQKINFGSASMIRPLMWFDKVDPRDPLQLTDGVWGLLCRYYFLNNSNVWLWVLYGNEQPKTWEMDHTSNRQPEWGARLQTPTAGGEMALTFHHRLSEKPPINGDLTPTLLVPENRLGLDGKWDVGPGIWFEAVWISKNKSIGDFTNQHILTLGADYTFGLGNGLNTILEHLVYTYHKKAFQMNNALSFSSASLSYPLGLSDQLGIISYYDWTNNGSYNMITWTRTFNNLSLHTMAFKNPKIYQVPFYDSQINLFAGGGLQVMGVWRF